jgi:hypothetical protein
VVRGCQAPERISAKPGGARKRAWWGCTERSCTSGLYCWSELWPILRRVKHVGSRESWAGIATVRKKGTSQRYKPKLICAEDQLARRVIGQVNVIVHLAKILCRVVLGFHIEPRGEVLCPHGEVVGDDGVESSSCQWIPIFASSTISSCSSSEKSFYRFPQGSCVFQLTFPYGKTTPPEPC